VTVRDDTGKSCTSCKEELLPIYHSVEENPPPLEKEENNN
jgi:hypothetical protein